MTFETGKGALVLFILLPLLPTVAGLWVGNGIFGFSQMLSRYLKQFWIFFFCFYRQMPKKGVKCHGLSTDNFLVSSYIHFPFQICLCCLEIWKAFDEIY